MLQCAHPRILQEPKPVTLAFAIPARHWLWTAALTPGTRRVVADRPLHPVRYKLHTGIVEADLPEGTVVLTTQAGVPRGFGSLRRAHRRPSACSRARGSGPPRPGGSTQRLHERLKRQAGLDDLSRRVRLPDGHAMTKGELRAWSSWYAVVTDVTARQVWVRAATTAEILAGGGVVPVAPVGQDLIDAIRAEVAETASEDEDAPAAA